jgi:hypothetical protein
MKPSRSRRRTALVALLALLVPLVVLWRGTLLRGVFFQADLVVYYYPAYTYATRVLRSGVLPLWAPEMEGGQPFHAQWEPTLLYPVEVPFRFLLPPWWALDGSLLFHYALAAAAMFAYARRLSLSRPAALVSAAIYAVNGFMIAHLEHPNLIVGAAWLPLLLLAVEHGLAGRTRAGVLGIGTVLGMMLLGGHPDTFLMGTLLVGLLVLLHPIHGVIRQRRGREALRPLGMLLGGYLLGLGLAAAQILPTLDLARLSWERHGASAGFQDTWSLKPLQYLVQLLPDLYGRNGQDTYWGVAHYWEECTYVGPIALTLAAAGLMSRHRLAGFYGGMAALSAWLAMGTNGLAFELLRQVPAFGTMRLPCRYMFLFDLSVAVLAGCGAHWLARIRRPAEQRRAFRLRGLLSTVVGIVVLWLLGWWLDRERWLREIASRLSERHRFHTPEIRPLLHGYVGQLGIDVALLLVGLALAVGLLLIATRSRGLRPVVPALAWLGIAVTLFLFGSGYHTVIPARLLAETPFTVRAMAATAPGAPFRVLQWDSIKMHANVAVHRGWWPTDERGYRQYIAALPGNYNLVWGLSSVRQEEWSALPLQYTRRLVSGILALGDHGGISAVEPYMPWLNAGYVLSQRPLRGSSLIPVSADRTRLYRSTDPGRRAWIVHRAAAVAGEAQLERQLTADPAALTRRVLLQQEDGGPSAPLPPTLTLTPTADAAGSRVRDSHRPPEEARIVTRTPTRLSLDAEARGDGYLVLGESWAPGWRAWVDGRAAPIYRANGIQRAVPLSAGRHRVDFRYLPTAFRLGLYLSAAALAVLLGLATARMGARA